MSRQVSLLALLCVSGIAGMSGCNSARYVTVDSTGGVVAIPSNSNSWPTYNHRHAEELIQAKCPGGYVIDREEEFVTGTTEYVDSTTNTKGDQMLAALRIAPVTQETQQRTTTSNQTEWRIYYHRKDAPMPAAGAAPPAAAVRPSGPPTGDPVPVGAVTPLR